jgi:DNA-binding MarR family transcriptional regulator
MAALKPLPPAGPMEFVRLRTIVGATDGNLGAHINTLEQAGYVAVEKDFDGKKPRTRVALTKQGRKAFETYVRYLRDIIES